MARLKPGMLRIACLYPFDDTPAPVASMDRIRFRRMAEALARAGHQVDLIYRRGPIVELGPGLRRVPLRYARWSRYDLIKTSIHFGFEQLARHGGADHEFILASLGSVVGSGPRPGVHFFGDKHERLLEIQHDIARRARAVTILTDENERIWTETHGPTMLRLRVPTGVDAVLPRTRGNPYRRLGLTGKGVLFAGNVYDDDQREVNDTWVQRLNLLGRALQKRGLTLVTMGIGDRDGLDRDALVELGAVPDTHVWDWQRHAVAGVVLAHGEVQDNESSKIYYYLRTELPTILESPIPNRWLVEQTGHGAIVPLNDVEQMADAAASFAGRRQSVNGVAEWMVREHSWDERAGRYQTLFEEAALRRPAARRARPGRAGTIVLVSPGLDERGVWGERILLRSLARALPGAFPGVRVEFAGVADVEHLDALRGDLVISVCTGPYPPWRADDIAAHTDGITMLWVQNRPDLISEFVDIEVDGFLTNSRRALPELARARPTVWCPLGVDRDWRPGVPQQRYRSDVVYLGSGGRGNKNPATTHHYLDPAKRFDFAIWGSDWSHDYWAPVHVQDPEANDWERYWRGPLVVGEEAALYSSAGLVLGFHEDNQRAWGMWNNRVFETLASGALLICDAAEGLEDELGDGLVLTAGGPQTAELIERYLAAPQEARRIAEAGRRMVMERYTYARNVAIIRDHYLTLAEARGIEPMRAARGVQRQVVT